MHNALHILDLTQGTLRLAARGGDFSLIPNQTMAHQDSVALAESREALAQLMESVRRVLNASDVVEANSDLARAVYNTGLRTAFFNVGGTLNPFSNPEY